MLVWLKPTFLGDAVMALPLLDGLIELGAHAVVPVGPMLRHVLADRADRLEMIDGARIKGIRSVLQEARRMRELHFDAALLVNRSFRSALVARLAGIPIRVGHATEGRRRLLTSSASYSPSKRESLCYLEIAALAGLEIDDREPRLHVSTDEWQTGFQQADGATIGLQPGARYPRKAIPQKVMVAVVRRFLDRGKRIVFLGGADERSTSAEVERQCGAGVVNLVGVTSVRESLGVLSQLDLMIGADTGLMHLAVAVGAPSVTVFGPNPESKWGHVTPRSRVLVAPKRQMSQMKADTIIRAADEMVLDLGAATS